MHLNHGLNAPVGFL